MAHDDRPDTRLGDIEFQFAHPQLDSSGSGKQAEHEVLPTQPEQETPTTVIEPLGRENYHWTLRGDCYRDEATELDLLVGDVVQLIHARHSATVYVKDVETSSQGVEDGVGWRYRYTAELIEVR